ncbi:MAG TPA: hypothetical protein PLY86_20060 [bacterium]|nr:hypothetical protein [bacterium]
MRDPSDTPDNGKIVHQLGFLTLYAAYLEEKIDDLLLMLDPIDCYTEDKQRWPISKRIKHAIGVIRKLDPQAFSVLVSDLTVCLDLFEERNELIHGRIYSKHDEGHILRSGRRNRPDREVTSGELNSLANEIFHARLAIDGPMIVDIPKAILEKASGTNERRDSKKE